MAMTKCKECRGEVSDRAKACVHCGAPLTTRRSFKGLLLIPFGAAAFVLLSPALIDALGLATPQYVHDANAAFAGCKALVETRAFRNKTMKDCDAIYEEAIAEGKRLAQSPK